MNMIQRLVADHLTSQLVEHLEVSEGDISDDVDAIVSESVNEEHYLEEIVLHQNKATTQKPTNINADLSVALPAILSQGALSALGGEASLGGAVAVLAGTVYTQSKVELSLEQGFVYYIGYKNRHKKWEIPQEELVEYVLEEVENASKEILISDERDVEQALVYLERNGCIERLVQHGTRYVVFRETCRSKWS